MRSHPPLRGSPALPAVRLCALRDGRRLMWCGAAGIVAVALAGCGSSGKSKPVNVTPASASAPCAGNTKTILAQLAGTTAAHVKAVRYTADSGAPSCRLSVRGAKVGHVVVSMEFDIAPQAYDVLEREVVEDTQQFGPVRLYPPPQAVNDMGLEAAWFPAADKVETTNGKTIYGVYITDWPGASAKKQEALAVKIARPLVAPSPKTGTLSESEIIK